MNFKIKWFLTCSFMILFVNSVFAETNAVKSNLELLRNQCLYFSVGYSPNNSSEKTIRHDLYAQSPFSPLNEIDIAASGISLAALPIAVDKNIISKDDAEKIAISASSRIKQMIQKSSTASTNDQVSKYGYKGMLYHFYTWNEEENCFIGNSGVEVSSIDTTLLMFGFLACAEFFNGQVMADYEVSLKLIQWKEWLDTNKNQFRMAYSPNSGFSGFWDTRTDEVSLICIMAAMSDPTIDIRTIWNGWRKELVTYIPPGQDTKKYTCYATWYGDPFTVFYGLMFFKFGYDFNGINWFEQSRIAYQGNVDFFKTERNYLDGMVLAFTDNSQGVIAKPKLSPDEPITKTISPVYGIAGGLEFYSNDPDTNNIAVTLSSLVDKNNNFFQGTGWPCESVIATDITHPFFSDYIIGQNISAIAILIDNYLNNGWLRSLIMKNSNVQRVFHDIFACNLLGIWTDGVYSWNKSTSKWTKISGTENAIMIASGKVDNDTSDDLIGVWSSGLYVKQSSNSQWIKLSSILPIWITAGDLNNDGKDEVIGSWKNDGVYYRNFATGKWIKISTSAKQLATGNIGGTRDDLAGVWNDGLWVRYSANASWQKLDSNIPFFITAGDISGDNRADIIGSYSTGTWYRNSANGSWTKLTTPSQQLASGDLDGDGRDDLVGIWADGIWVRYSANGQWQKITSSKPTWVTTGKIP